MERIERWVFILAVSLLVSPAYAAGGMGVSAQIPQLVTDPALIWDFGTVAAGEVVAHTFSFTNTTPGELQIISVNTSCGCTGSDMKKKTLDPGESTELQVKFDSKGYSGDIQQYIYVQTDNQENPVIQYMIKAQVVK